MEKTALIAGATGLVGFYLLQELLASTSYKKVTALVRKPIDIEHPRLEQVIFDFDNPDASKVSATHVYCCLGTTIARAGSKPAFMKVDYEYPLSLAQIAIANGCETFAIVTAVGANEKSLFFYNKVKGKIESELLSMPFRSLYIFRPSMLLGQRKEFRLGEEIGKVVMKTFRFIIPMGARAIHASQVAQTMVHHALSPESGIHIVDSAQMHKFIVK